MRRESNRMGAVTDKREARTTLTKADLEAAFAYDPQTGEFTWKSDRRVGRGNGRLHRRKGDRAGHVANGYLVLSIGRERFAAHRVAWLFSHGEWPIGEIDHKNCDPLDNRLENLRVATGNQNRANMPSRSPSGFKGVTKLKNANRYVAQITVNGKNRYLGCFKRAEDAHAAYVVAARDAFGEFARSK